jgi:hypothetical protein
MFAIIKFKKDHTIRREVFKGMYSVTFGPLSEGVNPKRWGSNVDLVSMIEFCLFNTRYKHPFSCQPGGVIDLSCI